MTQPTIHKLNKAMAEIAGKEIKEHVEGNPNGPEIRSGWVYLKRRTQYGEHWDWWDPCTDHNQMAMVKAKLVEANIGFVSGYDDKMKAFFANVGLNADTLYAKKEPLVNFAYAVNAWWETQSDRMNLEPK